MNCPITWSGVGKLITLVSTGVSAWAAWAMWKVSRQTLDLQHSIETDKKPFVSIWYDKTLETFDGHHGELVFINLGKVSLPVRALHILHNKPEKRISSRLFQKDELLDTNENHSYFEEQKDLIFKENEIIRLVLKSNDFPSQFKIRVMYYDNSFEFIEIDTSVLGGKYILKGKGK